MMKLRMWLEVNINKNNFFAFMRTILLFVALIALILGVIDIETFQSVLDSP